jgi:hypothetical protein
LQRQNKRAVSDANFRLIVSGHIGVKKIERLIKKLAFDKEILADQGEEESDEAADCGGPDCIQVVPITPLISTERTGNNGRGTH